MGVQEFADKDLLPENVMYCPAFGLVVVTSALAVGKPPDGAVIVKLLGLTPIPITVFELLKARTLTRP